jgi:hypothetical protein
MPMPKMATAVMTSMMLKPFLRRNQTNPNRLALISLLASVASFMPHHSQLFHFVRQNFGIESATSSFWQEGSWSISMLTNLNQIDTCSGTI